VDVDLTYEAAAGHEEAVGHVVPGYGPRGARQTLRWLSSGDGGEWVGEGWCVEVKAALDLVHTPGVYTECRVVRVGGVGGGWGEEEEEDGRS
jgi:hypothetical protein